MEKPKRVYKFHKINSYLFQLLESSSLWFSHQKDLNDPFDCKYSLSDSYMSKILLESSADLFNDLKNVRPDIVGDNPEQFYSQILPYIKNEYWFSSFYDLIFNNGGWSVCCFTTSPLNELLWSHYAENHCGVCLEFDFSNDQNFYDKLFKVEYTNVLPQINSADDIPKALLTKRLSWELEEEWRIITNVKGARVFDKRCLTGIYFGYRVPKSEIDRFKRVLNNNLYQGVNGYQIRFNLNGFNIDPIQP